MITRDVIEKYLSPRLGEHKWTRQGVKFCCPVCDEGKKFNLEFNLDRNIFNCWSCRYSGVFPKAFREYAVDNTWKNIPEFRDMEGEAVEETEEKPINYPVMTAPFYTNLKVADYLINTRGMDRDWLIQRKVSYVYSQDEVYSNHICFPMYEGGQLVGACLQDFGSKRYRNLGKLSRYVPYAEFVNPLYPITITEGCYDAGSGVNAIPLLTTQINNPTIEFLRGKDVILAVDNTIELDHFGTLLKRAGETARTVSIFNLYDHKDMNEFYIKDRKGFLAEYNTCIKELINR